MKEKGKSFSETIVSYVSFGLWVVYQILRLILGLIAHPYRTVREIMRGRWFIPLVFVPSVLLVWILVTGRIAAWVVDVPYYSRDFLGIFYSTFIISIGLWQILLFYLAVRFWVGLRR